MAAVPLPDLNLKFDQSSAANPWMTTGGTTTFGGVNINSGPSQMTYLILAAAAVAGVWLWLRK